MTSQTKYVIENGRQFFEKEKRKGSSIKRKRIVEHTAEATGVSIRSVHNINNEYISQEGGTFCLWKVLLELGFSYKKRDNIQYINKQRNIL